MAVLWVQLATDEFLIIFLDITCLCYFQQVVTGIHLFTQRVERAYHLGNIGNDGVGIIVGNLGKKVCPDR